MAVEYEDALIVSASETGVNFFTEMLVAASYGTIKTSPSGQNARQLVSAYKYGLVVINAPLIDESGEQLARQIVSNGIGEMGVSQVILAAQDGMVRDVTGCESDGVLILFKPINRAVFSAALRAARASGHRLSRLYEENIALKRKLDDIRIVDRAKCILISVLHMNERDAHRFIEKQAMDMRSSKRAVAENIIKTYDIG